MSNFALRRGRGPVFPDLPPTLQPCPVLAAAPRPDAVRTALLSSLVYGLLAGGAIAIASLAGPSVLPPVLQPTRPDRVIELDGPPRPRPTVERTGPSSGGGGSGETAVARGLAPSHSEPEAPAEGLPTRDRSQELPGPARAGAGPEIPAAQPGSGSGQGVHDFTASAPAILRQVDPLYPELARRARVQGTVVLLMVVDEGGIPLEVRVLDGPPALRDAAIQAARQWRFEPARLDGRPVAASFRLTLNFRLK